MYLTRKWNEIMGPKDERLEAEEGKATKVAAYILLFGSTLSLYYAIMLNQVAYTTDQPIMTPLGEGLMPVSLLLAVTILLSGIASMTVQLKSGTFSSYKRFAEVDRIPWDYVSLFAVSCGALIGVLTCAMRIVAEIQIVGIAHVAWLGDMAIGIVFFIMGFSLGFVAIAYTIHDAIKRRQKLEADLEA